MDNNEDYDTPRINEALEKSRNNRWTIVEPFALSWDGWDNWKQKLKAEFPIRYFFQNTLIKFVKYEIWWPIRRPFKDLKNQFKWRFIKKHQYNVIRPKTLKPGYYDADTRILHGCMHELVEYVEHEANIVSWDEEPHASIWKDIQTIYTWWTQVYPTREDKWDAANPTPELEDSMDLFRRSKENDPRMTETKKIYVLRREMEAKWEKEEDDMLTLLLKVRRYLWS